jgi:hypothetical protein
MSRTKTYTDGMIYKALRRSGGDAHEAAAMLGCSVFPIDEYRRRKGKTRRITKTPAVQAARAERRAFSDDRLLAAVVVHGNDTPAIARKLGCAKVTVNKHLRRHGLQQPQGARPGCVFGGRRRATHA